jgi:hypothetical protein
MTSDLARPISVSDRQYYVLFRNHAEPNSTDFGTSSSQRRKSMTPDSARSISASGRQYSEFSEQVNEPGVLGNIRHTTEGYARLFLANER